MIFICNASNVITPIFGNTLRQGEINANEILLLAPYSANTVVTMTVELPNGLIIPQEPNAYVLDPVPIGELVGLPINLGTSALNAWKMRIDGAISQFAGSVTFQFFFSLTGTDVSYPQTFSSTSVVSVIPRGVPIIGSEEDYNPSLRDIYTEAVVARSEAMQAASDAALSMDRAEMAAVDTANLYNWFDEQYGDIHAALEEIISIADNLIAGGTNT